MRCADGGIEPMQGPQDHAPFPTGRFARALLLAHCAAASAMAAGMNLVAGVANLFDPDIVAHGLPSPGRIVEIVVYLPLVTAVFAVWIAVLLIPYSLVGALVAWPLVATRCVGQRGASLCGGGAGVVLATARLWLDEASGSGSRWDLVSLWLVGCGLAAGAAFGWVVWRIAIRPSPRHPPHRVPPLRPHPAPHP